jgi:quinol monooxygenase YgiN
MIIRIVKMSFDPTKVDAFLANFEQHKASIRAFEGCQYLELLQEEDSPGVFFTYSKWNSEEHLNAYRHSDLFKGVWSFTKRLFNAAPEAWSLQSIKTLA